MRTIAAVIVALALLAPGAARADEISDPVLAEAKALYDDGIKLYGEGRYAEAARRFARSYELSKAPGLLWNLAQSHRLAGDCAEAYQSYLAYLRADPAAENANDARAHLEETKRCADERGDTDPKPDDPPPDVTPPPAVTPPAAAPPPERVDRGRTRRLVGLIVTGVGVGLVGFGVFSGFQALDSQDELEARFQTPDTWDADDDELQARGERQETFAIVFTSVGVAAVATGVTLYLLGREPGRSSAAITPTEGGAAVTWSTRF